MTSSDHSAWLASLLENLDSFGPDAIVAAAYIRQRGTRVGVHEQTTGARWTADRRIEINPRYARLAPDHPQAVALIIHEVRHLQQGMLTALSVYGELEAWQLQFNFLRSVTGRYHDNSSFEAIIAKLMLLPLGWDRTALESARALMQAYAGKIYRVDLLPLYPLPLEIRYRITRTQPSPR